ncbi:MAG: sporulation protein [Actinophytocola sp.]|uniref:sporulation protein n=1 Tax=Actinophytocola sp. TaxID=1872138 RepID=UPI003C71E8A7
MMPEITPDPLICWQDARMFQKVMASFGQGGATIDARILDRHVRPGGTLHGEVILVGGQIDQEVESLSVTLLARVEHGEGETADLPFQNVQLAGKELVRAGAQIKVPFELQMAWETPVTTVFGKYLTGMAVGLQTNLNLARTVVDPHDVDAIPIEPVPAQHRILDAMTRIGFKFRDATLVKNRVDGVDQQLPFFQEINFTPSPAFANVFDEVAISFLARPRDVQVVLDVRKRVRVLKGGGLGGRAQSRLGTFVVEYAALGRTNWEQQIEGWLHEVAKPRGIFD